jgi:thiamine-phosphate diphosphorylase
VSPRRPPALVGITPGTAAEEGQELERRVARALAGGLAGLVLREPGLEDRDYLALALRLRARGPGLWLALHDRPHLVRAAGADAVHLGWRSLAPAEVRPWLDAGIAVGLSTHAGDAAGRWEGADYLFHGPVYAAGKPGAADPVGPAGLAEAVRRARVDVLGLGGITPERAAEVRSSGAAGIAVLSGLFGGADPASRAREYLGALAR